MDDAAFERVLESSPVTTTSLTQVWQQRWVRVAVVAIVAAIAGLVVALTMPYGPATATQALVVMGTGFLVGLAGGLVMRSGWAILITVIAYIVAVELGRMDAAGPTVDAIRLDNMFSILAFVLGRGFHGVVGLLPMILGAMIGITWANRSAVKSPGRVRQALWWAVMVLLAVIVLFLAVLILLPAETPPIVDAAGEVVPGSIAELITVPIGGHDQAIMVRAYDAGNPILLYLSGGPGQSSLPWPRVLFEDLTRDFVLVGWDQRGTGKSYAALAPAGTLTVDQMVADTIELTKYLRDRFGEEKIYLLGESWGTTLAVLAAQQRPDLYHAVIGSGQMVSQLETDRRIYHDLLDYAERTGDQALVAQLHEYGEPPYADMFAYVFVMGYYDALTKPYTFLPEYVAKGTQANLGPWNILGSEYNLVEKINVLRGFLDMGSILYPQLQGIDFRRDVPELDTAVYVLDGTAELDARRDLALEWYELLDAPLKRIYAFDHAAHAPAFEQFADFTQIITETVLPETYR